MLVTVEMLGPLYINPYICFIYQSLSLAQSLTFFFWVGLIHFVQAGYALSANFLAIITCVLSKCIETLLFLDIELPQVDPDSSNGGENDKVIL